MLPRVIVLHYLIIATVSSASHICRTSRKEFKCIETSNCIDTKYVCDGTKDCSDGSDEDSCFTRKRRQTANCILPPYPTHGTYEVLNTPKHRGPGQSFEAFVLRVRCDRGYGIIETGFNSFGTQEVFCVNGNWYQEMPQCVRFCKLDPDPSVRYMCPRSKICNLYVAPGTLVNPVCNSPVYYSSESLPYMQCVRGSWDYIAKCKPDCGRITPEGVQLVIDGTPAKRGELPWHVGIYRKTKPYMQICGGSLVSNNVVISAAHCFWNDVKKLLPSSDYAVATGKLHRPWDDERDVDAQKSDVKHIAIPDLFRGAASNFQEDIAILTLTTPFVYKTYIRPVCLSFDLSFERWHLQQGNLGKVAGWGLTGANGPPSQVLQVVDIPFINEATCINTLPPSFTAYITGDKFCAGYTNGTALCKGDSGGGLVFSEKEQGLDRYYLRGIVSTAPTTADKMCNDKSYTTFTKITKHEDFIQNSLAVANGLKGCPSFMFQCADGTCEDREAYCGQIQGHVDSSYESDKPYTTAMTTVSTTSLPVLASKTGAKAQKKCLEYSRRLPYSCQGDRDSRHQKYINGSREATRNEFPHMALLGYGTDLKSAEWLSSGFVISERFILTAAHYLNSFTDVPVEFAVLGILKRSDSQDSWKVHRIKRTIPHPGFEFPEPINDIALLETENEIIFDHSILPICLDVGDTDFKDATVPGWGADPSRHYEDTLLDTLKVVGLRELTESECLLSYPPRGLFRSGYNRTTMMCYDSNEENTPGPCPGDSGSPLQAVDKKCLYTAIGIMAFGKSCSTAMPTGFTRVAFYLPWIEDIVWPEVSTTMDVDMRSV